MPKRAHSGESDTSNEDRVACQETENGKICGYAVSEWLLNLACVSVTDKPRSLSVTDIQLILNNCKKYLSGNADKQLVEAARAHLEEFGVRADVMECTPLCILLFLVDVHRGVGYVKEPEDVDIQRIVQELSDEAFVPEHLKI